MDGLALTRAALEFIDARRRIVFENASGDYGDEDRASVLRELAQITLETERLSRILGCARAMARMRHPSVERILRARGFGFEADRMRDLVVAIEAFSETSS